MNKKILALSLITLFAGSNSALAQLDIDLSAASVGVAPQNSINIGNISVGDVKYSATLQWNPMTATFDIARASLESGNEKICSLGRVLWYRFGNNDSANIMLTSDSSNRTITITYTTIIAYNSSMLIDERFRLSIIQNNSQLYLTKDSGSLNSNTALLTQLPDPVTGGAVNWYNIPAGHTRYAQITQIPTWFNFALPVSALFEGNTATTYTCR